MSRTRAVATSIHAISQLFIGIQGTSPSNGCHENFASCADFERQFAKDALRTAEVVSTNCRGCGIRQPLAVGRGRGERSPATRRRPLHKVLGNSLTARISTQKFAFRPMHSAKKISRFTPASYRFLETFRPCRKNRLQFLK